jgi:hypothetical protein
MTGVLYKLSVEVLGISFPFTVVKSDVYGWTGCNLPSTEQGALRALLIQVSALPLILQIAK